MSYVVTGGCGFIGSNFVNYLHGEVSDEIIVIDKMTYASNIHNITVKDRVRVVKLDISKPSILLEDIFRYNKIKGVFNFAAESHVDNSITGPSVFIESNIQGTFNLLELSRIYSVDRFLQISTDEVYGSLCERDLSFTEDFNLLPNNVYSATKAAADLLVRSYHKTYGLNTATTRCCNNYGPRQHREKLIPKVIYNALNYRPIPVYGRGTNIREWIHVLDHCTAIKTVFDYGQTGEVYNIGSGIEYENIEIVNLILKLTKKPTSLIKFVTDRAGHDFRYSIDCSKFNTLVSLNNKDNKPVWELKYGKDVFSKGLGETVDWYTLLYKQTS